MSNNIAIIRAKREFQKCSTLKNFEITLKGDNILEWDIKYTPNSDIFKKRYTIFLKISDDYPFSAPKLCFTEYIFHPNIDKDGKMCSSLLSEWQSSYTIFILLESIHTQFIEPNLENPINIEACKMVQENLENYKKKVN